MPDPVELIVACPRCRQRGKWFTDKWGPFCSRRCKLIDLGAWAEGRYSIAGAGVVADSMGSRPDVDENEVGARPFPERRLDS